MCSISGSFSRDKLAELCDLNRYRGEHSHSIAFFEDKPKESITPETNLVSLTRGLGPIPTDALQYPEKYYCIVHQQAPTTDNTSIENIHPAEYNGILLWHNGILKPSTIFDLQQKLDSKSTWDTQLLCQYIDTYVVPGDIDGSFACVCWLDFGLELFRNEISPLFYDDDMNISSTKFPGSKPITPNTLNYFHPFTKWLQPSDIMTFKTVCNPYLFDLGE